MVHDWMTTGAPFHWWILGEFYPFRHPKKGCENGKIGPEKTSNLPRWPGWVKLKTWWIWCGKAKNKPTQPNPNYTRNSCLNLPQDIIGFTIWSLKWIDLELFEFCLSDDTTVSPSGFLPGDPSMSHLWWKSWCSQSRASHWNTSFFPRRAEVGHFCGARHRTEKGISLAVKFTKKMSVPSKDWKWKIGNERSNWRILRIMQINTVHAGIASKHGHTSLRYP